MSKILKILHFQNKGKYALVNVLLNDGTDAVVYVGGDCEVFLHKGQIKAFVKRNSNERNSKEFNKKP